MGMEDEVGRLTTVEADKSKKEGIEEVPTTVPDPPQAGGGHGGAGNQQTKAEVEFWYCGKKGHKESE